MSISFEAVDPDGGEKASNASYKWLDTEKEICDALGGQNVNASGLLTHHKHILEVESLEKKHEEDREKLIKEIVKSAENNDILSKYSLDEDNIDALKDILDQINQLQNKRSTKEEKLREDNKKLREDNEKLLKISELPLPYNNHSSVVNIYTDRIREIQNEKEKAETEATEAKEQLKKIKKKLSEIKSTEAFADELKILEQGEEKVDEETPMEEIKQVIPNAMPNIRSRNEELVQSGKKKFEAAVQKIAAGKRGKKKLETAVQKIAAGKRGKKKLEAAVQKIAAGKRGKKKLETAVQKIAAGKRGKKKLEAAVQKIAAGKRGKKKLETAVQKIAAGKRGKKKLEAAVQKIPAVLKKNAAMAELPRLKQYVQDGSPPANVEAPAANAAEERETTVPNQFKKTTLKF